MEDSLEILPGTYPLPKGKRMNGQVISVDFKLDSTKIYFFAGFKFSEK